MSEAKPERQMFVNDSHHVTRIAGGEVEDRLTEANQDVLRLPADQFAGLFLYLGFGQNAWARSFRFLSSR